MFWIFIIDNDFWLENYFRDYISNTWVVILILLMIYRWVYFIIDFLRVTYLKSFLLTSISTIEVWELKKQIYDEIKEEVLADLKKEMYNEIKKEILKDIKNNKK